MKSTGIVRKVDELGRIVLPIEMRRTLDIGEKDALEIYVEGSSVINLMCCERRVRLKLAAHGVFSAWASSALHVLRGS